MKGTKQMIKLLDEKTINITEIFSSIQGETHLSGLPTLFIRTASCNLRCTWCDTPYSFGRGETMSLSDLLERVEKSELKRVCVTGGEPLLHETIYPLMTTLCDRGYAVSLETGGSLDTAKVDERVTTVLDVKCPGSGMEGKNFWKNLAQLREEDVVKFVLLDRADYEYAMEVIRRYELETMKNAPLLSPVFGKLPPALLVEWILADNANVRLNLQVHKYIWHPEQKGV